MGPMKFRLSSPFGVLEEIRDGRVHTGIDLAMPEGTQLRSVVEGIADVVDYGSTNIGKGVIIQTEDGMRFIYGHLSKIAVKDGERVSVGEYIGNSGATGHSHGAHLHFGIKQHGEYIDPTPLAERVAGMSGQQPWYKDPLRQLRDKISGEVHEAVDQAKHEAIDSMKEHIIEFIQALGGVFLEYSSAVTLIGTALLIILRIAGLQQGYRWAGILFTVNALLRLIWGGVLR